MCLILRDLQPADLQEMGNPYPRMAGLSPGASVHISQSTCLCPDASVQLLQLIYLSPYVSVKVLQSTYLSSHRLCSDASVQVLQATYFSPHASVQMSLSTCPHSSVGIAQSTCLSVSQSCLVRQFNRLLCWRCVFGLILNDVSSFHLAH